MVNWKNRTREERYLLNPSFCAILLWYAASGYLENSETSISFEESFIVLPMILPLETREGLPRTVRTSLAVWLQQNPLMQGRIESRARFLVPYTKDALIFGGIHDLIHFKNGCLYPNTIWGNSSTQLLRTPSAEVVNCIKRAVFIGKWFAQIDNSVTVLALLGVRP